MSNSTISWLFRRKRTSNFSIENSFAEVHREWGDENKPIWVEAQFSEGFTNRLNIIRDSRKIQTDILHITGDIHLRIGLAKWRRGDRESS